MYGDFVISDMPLASGRFRSQVESFLAENGLRLDPVDRYVVLTRGDSDEILAGGGLSGDVIKCVAVSEKARSEGLMGRLVSHLLSLAAENGHQSVKVFTKPQNQPLFEDLGFRLVGRAPKAILMENGRGVSDEYNRLCGFRMDGKAGVIVMHADPMTQGHEYLISRAAEQVDCLFVIVLGGDRSRFPAASRFEMVRSACRRMDNVRVLEGGAYCISGATFPSYFLKNLDEAAEQQMRLDLDIFGRHIAPALRASVRFAGSEPLDPMTARYNTLMRELLPGYGLEFREIPRKESDGRPVSASQVRVLLDAGDWTAAAALCPPRVRWYLMGDVAAAALRRELDAPDKPGMVCPDSRGSHEDMDYALMRKSIDAIRPWFVRLSSLARERDAVFPSEVTRLGLEAERAMLRATGGVNTHKGAIFALGIMAAAAGCVLRDEGTLSAESLSRQIRLLAGDMASLETVAGRRTYGSEIVREHGVRGALDMALDGYADLFSDWLPYWRSVEKEPYGPQKTLLRILSTLDDTCVIHRAGYARAQEIKAEAAALLADFSPVKLKTMNDRFVSERVSPGGSADMLALTMYAGCLINT